MGKGLEVLASEFSPVNAGTVVGLILSFFFKGGNENHNDKMISFLAAPPVEREKGNFH